MKRFMMAIFLMLVSALGASAQISMEARDWQIKYSQGTPAHPIDAGDMPGWYFDIPNDPGYVGYVTIRTRGVKDLSVFTSLIVTMDLETSAFPVYICESACSDAAATVYIEHNRWTYLSWYKPYHRWWAWNARYSLNVGGQVTLTIPIDPSQWLSVWGEHGDASPEALAGFWNTMTNVGNVGMTFGGGGNFGHGVGVTDGTATFRMLDIYLE